MDREPQRPPDRFRAHHGLIAFASVAAMAEAGVVIAFAPAARSVAPQVSALAPLAAFHDLRWLYASGLPALGFTLALAGLVLARSAVNVLLARLAWPTGMAPPRPAAALRSSLVLTVAAYLLMSPVASLSFGVAILPFSWPFLGTLPAVLLLALPLSHGGVTTGWWRDLAQPAAMGWLLTDFAVLSVAAAIIGRLPAASAVPLAGLAGLVNARAWYSVTAGAVQAHARTAPARRRPWALRRIPAAPVAVVVAIALVVAATRIAFLIGVAYAHVGQAAPASPPAARTQPAPGSAHRGVSRRPPVLEVAGFGSTCCRGVPSLARVMPGRLVQQFSYRGLKPSGAPLPYGTAASDLPLPVLGDRMAAQVEWLHAETGRRVDVVAESEGTLGVDAMLAEHPNVPVGSVALLSPIVAPGRVSYQEGTGPGSVPGTELQAVVWFVGGLSPFGTSGAQTLIGSVNQTGARFAASAARHRPFHLLRIVPLADALTLPVCTLPPDLLVVPAFHGELLSDPVALQMVRGFLLHQPVRATARARATAEVLAAAGSAWRIPESATPSPPCRR